VSTNNQIAITNLVRQNGAVHPALGHADPSATSRSEARTNWPTERPNDPQNTWSSARSISLHAHICCVSPACGASRVCGEIFRSPARARQLYRGLQRFSGAERVKCASGKPTGPGPRSAGLDNGAHEQPWKAVRPREHCASSLPSRPPQPRRAECCPPPRSPGRRAHPERGTCLRRRSF